MKKPDIPIPKQNQNEGGPKKGHTSKVQPPNLSVSEPSKQKTDKKSKSRAKKPLSAKSNKKKIAEKGTSQEPKEGISEAILTFSSGHKVRVTMESEGAENAAPIKAQAAESSNEQTVLSRWLPTLGGFLAAWLTAKLKALGVRFGIKTE